MFYLLQNKIITPQILLTLTILLDDKTNTFTSNGVSFIVERSKLNLVRS